VVAVKRGRTKSSSTATRSGWWPRTCWENPRLDRAIRPLKGGVIADFEITEKMLSYFIRKIHNRARLAKPRLVIAIPAASPPSSARPCVPPPNGPVPERSTWSRSRAPRASASDSPSRNPRARWFCRHRRRHHRGRRPLPGHVVVSESVRVAGDNMDQAIVEYMRKNYNLLIGEPTAERIKIQIGSAYPLEEELEMEVKGRDLIAGLPRKTVINSAEIARPSRSRAPPSPTPSSAPRKDPPELASDLVDSGMVMCGGGSLLRGLDRVIAEETGLPVRVADDPSAPWPRHGRFPGPPRPLAPHPRERERELTGGPMDVDLLRRHRRGVLLASLVAAGLAGMVCRPGSRTMSGGRWARPSSRGRPARRGPRPPERGVRPLVTSWRRGERVQDLEAEVARLRLENVQLLQRLAEREQDLAQAFRSGAPPAAPTSNSPSPPSSAATPPPGPTPSPSEKDGGAASGRGKLVLEATDRLIAAGKRDGVAAGDTVLDPPTAAVVGRVTAVGPFHSVVRLVTDPGSVLRAQVLAVREGQPDRTASGILLGSQTGAPRLRLEYVDRRHDVRPGDLVLTSGYGGSSPRRSWSAASRRSAPAPSRS